MGIEQGFNSDIVHLGKKFHIQTEDWGDDNPFIVTRVYQSGAVLLSLKTPYEKVLKSSTMDRRQVVRLAMREQHQKVLDQLVSGTLSSDSLR